MNETAEFGFSHLSPDLGELDAINERASEAGESPRRDPREEGGHAGRVDERTALRAWREGHEVAAKRQAEVLAQEGP